MWHHDVGGQPVYRLHYPPAKVSPNPLGAGDPEHLARRTRIEKRPRNQKSSRPRQLPSFAGASIDRRTRPTSICEVIASPTGGIKSTRPKNGTFLLLLFEPFEPVDPAPAAPDALRGGISILNCTTSGRTTTPSDVVVPRRADLLAREGFLPHEPVEHATHDHPVGVDAACCGLRWYRLSRPMDSVVALPVEGVPFWAPASHAVSLLSRPGAALC